MATKLYYTNTYKLYIGDSLSKTEANALYRDGGTTWDKVKKILIENPTQFVCDIKRNAWGSTHTMTGTLFGLAPSTRTFLFFDELDFTAYRPVVLYLNEIKVFEGNLRVCQSYKDGPNMVTTFEAWDGGWDWLNSRSSFHFGRNVTKAKMATELANKLTQCRLINYGESVTSEDTTLQSSRLAQRRFHGNPMEILKAEFSVGAYLEMGNLFLLDKKEYTSDSKSWITHSGNGLIGSPKLSGISVEWRQMFSPQIRMRDFVFINSRVNFHSNDSYSIMSLHHHYESGNGESAPNSYSDFAGWRKDKAWRQVNGKIELARAYINT